MAGVVWFLRDRRWRVLGLTFVVFFVLMEVVHGKTYYLFPIYPMVLAGGAVVIERWLAKRAVWTRAAVVAVIVLAALPLHAVDDVDAAAGTASCVYNGIGFKPGEAGGETRVAVAAGGWPISLDGRSW